MATEFLSPQEAWQRILNYRERYYNSLAAMYSGDHDALRRTARPNSYWKRAKGANRLHFPIAADIAATSAALLFSKEPKFTVYHEGTEANEGEQQRRLEAILEKNSWTNKLNEGAETLAAMADLYIKIRWSKDLSFPVLDIVQPDDAWPEYVFGELKCVHFFTQLRREEGKDETVRVYERYTRGRIEMRLFRGSADDLGAQMSGAELQEMGYSPTVAAPVDELLAVHIANLRPNRRWRSSMMGRSDLDGLRDLCDSLDETYSAWMRDIRLAKARLIVPMDYLRTRPQALVEGVRQAGACEFDADVETYVAMDIDPDRSGTSPITPSQFAIRSAEYAQTAAQYMQDILQSAGYSPQSFGLNINGSAQSGTALNIRERRSAVTKNKKQTYLRAPLEQILTAAVRLDHALYPDAGSDGRDIVKMEFSDSMGEDISTLSTTVEMLNRAAAVSLYTKVRMLHPDWSEQDIAEEVDAINAEYGSAAQTADAESIQRILAGQGGREDEEQEE